MSSYVRSHPIDFVLSVSDVVDPHPGRVVYLLPAKAFRLYDETNTWVTWPTGGVGGSITLQEEGVNVDTAMAVLNIVGHGATAKNTGSGLDTITIPGVVVGPIGSRPVMPNADLEGMLYAASDTGVLYVSNGVTWTALVITGGSLADVIAAGGPIGSATTVPQITWDTKGRLTVVGSVAISIPAGSVTGLAAIATSGSATDLIGGTVAAGRMPAHTGDATSSVGTVALSVVGLHLTTLVKSTNYTLLTTDSVILASGAITLTLPTAVGVAGKVYTVKKTDTSTSTIVVNTTSNQTIDGEATTTLNDPYESFDFVSDGANWLIV